jgi:hypothetical protein
MSGICRLVALTALVGLPDLAAGQTLLKETAPVPARSTSTSTSVIRNASPVIQTASLSSGWIEGSVTDERSRPVVGAAVSAQGRDLLLVETDTQGKFTMRSVPAGTYLVRVQGRGYAASKREFLQVLPSRGTTHLVRLHRLGDGIADLSQQPHLLTAGVSASQLQAPNPVPDPVAAAVNKSPEQPNDNNDDHSEVAWRLRHVKRSVLRDSTNEYMADDFGKNSSGDDYWRDKAQLTLRDWTAELGRATASFLTGTALSGRVQLMTASAFDEPFEAFSAADMPSGVAYFSLGAPVSAKTAWTVEAAVMQGDVSSWFVAGTYATTLNDTHGIDVGSSYARQRYSGVNPQALAAFRDADNSRNVGGVSLFDRWTLSPRTLLTYGARYEHYDYLKAPSLLSPSVTLAISPFDKTWIRGNVSQRMSAPGADEFVPQPLGSLVLPPQQTFAAITPGSQLGRERARTVGFSVEHEVATLVLGARYFRQDVDDQIVTVFGMRGGPGPGYPIDLGHYGVATGGSFVAGGWGFSMSRPVAQLLRTTLEYRTARAYWGSLKDIGQLMTVAPSAMRPPEERVHDLTARIESEVPYTATRILAIYRLNTAYARSDSSTSDPVAAARFDVQIHQALPFLQSTHARWELLLAVRNLLHDTQDPTASIYDELLVVRPPKRVVGGVTVQF